MPRDECNQEQLWALIQERKQTRNGHENAPARAAGEPCPVADEVLVDVLYQALRQPELGGSDGAHARLQLQAVIAADLAARPAQRPPRTGFWQVGGRRQLLLVLALLLLTVASIAFIMWSNRTPACSELEVPSAAAPIAAIEPGKASKGFKSTPAADPFAAIQAQAPLKTEKCK